MLHRRHGIGRGEVDRQTFCTATRNWIGKRACIRDVRSDKKLNTFGNDETLSMGERENPNATQIGLPTLKDGKHEARPDKQQK